ncbi:hypothetical protein F5Y16DRAFT_362448 [Xylariaceae sp. FL0255]|nr:hypothetical protein F5Y16DRAFT_362448 [Xylariaceae sp. FL0255]
MNISRIDGSRYGAVLFIPPSHATAFARAVGLHNGCRRSITTHLRPPTEQQCPTTYRPCLPSPRHFCVAVAPVAGRLPSPNFFTSDPVRTRSWNHTAVATNENVTKRQTPQKQSKSNYNDPPPIQSKEEMMALVDQYDDVSVDEHLEFYRDPFMRKYAPSNGPELRISDKKEDLELPTLEGSMSQDQRYEAARDLEAALSLRIRRRSKVSLDTIWGLYQEIPEPKAIHMSSFTRRRFFRALGDVERKNHKSMLRYFAAVADVKNAGLALTLPQWNAAMSFAARYVSKTTDAEVESALQVWREMEKDTHIRANEVTFNVLFDAASKAGNFNLAEMIYREMNNRGFGYNRYHHVSLIYFFGLKTDSSGVRAAYREMVEEGEIIDTTVLNCVIASFIRCGEEDAAERVYEKMKASNKDLPVKPYRSYTMAKAVTQVLMMFARVGKQHPDMRPGFQEPALLFPNLHTYRILINHYGLRLGDLSKVAQYLDEMKHFRIPVHGAIFLAMFKSFGVYGGTGSDWSAQRLKSVWDAFLHAFDSGADGLHISTWLAMAILRAHARYANRQQLIAVYDELKSRWTLDEENTEFMLSFLSNLLKKTGLHTTSRRALANIR